MPTDLSLAFYISYVALWILVILHSLVLLGLLRMVYQLQQSSKDIGTRIVGLNVGQMVPDLKTVDISGVPVSTVDDKNRVLALLFISPDCESCVETLNEIEGLSSEAQRNMIMVCRAGPKECIRITERHKLLMRVIADENSVIARRFGITSFPTAVLVNEAHIVKSVGHPARVMLIDVLKEESHVEPQSITIDR